MDDKGELCEAREVSRRQEAGGLRDSYCLRLSARRLQKEKEVSTEHIDSLAVISSPCISYSCSRVSSSLAVASLTAGSLIHSWY